MVILGSGAKKIVVDEDGFLDASQTWNEDVARLLAQHEGIEDLDEEKLEIVTSMRKYYAEHASFPILGNICRKAGNKAKDCVTKEFLDPMKAWKIAGLPKPSNVFFTSFDGKKYIANPFY
jgi:TusE/DsrC/DsvC family sulfur relay protein